MYRGGRGFEPRQARHFPSLDIETMYFVYILQSLKNGSYYIGYSNDVDRRLAEHNRGKAKATRYEVPFKLVYTETFTTSIEAKKREYFLKRQKSRKYIVGLILNSPPLAR